jgi:hypothetical protein
MLREGLKDIEAMEKHTSSGNNQSIALGMVKYNRLENKYKYH